MSEDKRELIDRLYRRDAEYCGVVNEFGEGAREIARLRAIRDELVAALDVLLRYVDEEAEDGMMQCVETQLARDTLAKARGESA